MKGGGRRGALDEALRDAEALVRNEGLLPPEA